MTARGIEPWEDDAMDGPNAQIAVPRRRRGERVKSTRAPVPSGSIVGDEGEQLVAVERPADVGGRMLILPRVIIAGGHRDAIED